MAELSAVFNKVCDGFKFDNLNALQQTAIAKLVKEKRDVFVSLPTGYGKSVIYQALPLAFDEFTGESGHVVIVISPLLALIEDQMETLRALGIASVSLSHIKTEEDMNEVERGSYAVVYCTPEGLLKNERWRRMLCSGVYLKKLCAIAVDEAHVIKQWGTSSTSKMAPFRECYGRLNELRSLAPQVNIIALTATATKNTKDAIIDILLMKTPYDISESPDKPNITYVVEYMPRDTSIQQYFSWLAAEVQDQGVRTERTIIYCQTIKQCGTVYSTLKAMLGNSFFVDKIGDRKNVIIEMLHSCSPSANKESILNSFRDVNGSIRILVATVAFGMGVDCKGVHRTIHFGPSKNIEYFVQETGRAGRDGAQSTSYLLYHGLLLTHVDKDIKEYVKLKDCRRKALLQQFGNTPITQPIVDHLCCDNCALKCKCQSPECGNQSRHLSEFQPTCTESPICLKERNVTQQQKDDVLQRLTTYHKSLVMQFLGEHAHGDIKSFTNLHMLIGFSSLQISQVLENCSKLFTKNDIYNFVEIWSLKHANKIQTIISEVFGDVAEAHDEQTESSHQDDELEEDLELALAQWNDIIEDDDFLDLILGNLSNMSLLDSVDEASDTSSHVEIPNAALEVLENFSFKES